MLYHYYCYITRSLDTLLSSCNAVTSNNNLIRYYLFHALKCDFCTQHFYDLHLLFLKYQNLTFTCMKSPLQPPMYCIRDTNKITKNDGNIRLTRKLIQWCKQLQHKKRKQNRKKNITNFLKIDVWPDETVIVCCIIGDAKVGAP